MAEFEPKLLILMRNDMQSITGGRAAAQAAHASSHFTWIMENLASANPNEMEKQSIVSYQKWRDSTTQKFGTTIVLEVDEAKIYELITCAEANFITEIIRDPSYPVKDGKTIHYVNIITCAYIFMDDPKRDTMITKMLKELPLW